VNQPSISKQRSDEGRRVATPKTTNKYKLLPPPKSYASSSSNFQTKGRKYTKSYFNFRFLEIARANPPLFPLSISNQKHPEMISFLKSFGVKEKRQISLPPEPLSEPR
jgi:hypothetical protein